jgi:hypothetical protein
MITAGSDCRSGLKPLARVKSVGAETDREGERDARPKRPVDFPVPLRVWELVRDIGGAAHVEDAGT